MKRFLILFLALSVGSSVYASQYVHGYYRSNGTYVQPYHRSNADSSRLNNYSTRGNYNPYTSKPGTVNPYNNYNYNNNYSNNRRYRYGY